MINLALKRQGRNDVLKIVLIYAIFSCLWIYLSDTALGLFNIDTSVLIHLSVVKGFLFVVITSVLLYQLISRYLLESTQLKSTILKKDELFSVLYEGMLDAFVSVDMTGKILQYNEVYRAMLGYEADELLSKTYLDLTPEKWHSMELKIVEEQVLQKGYSEIYEKEYRRKDGTTFPVELRTHLIRDDLGTPYIMWAIVRDITERKLAQDKLAEKSIQLEELNQSLEKRVENAISELRQKDQIIIQQSRLASMGEMINNIAHQWRQPLNNIGLIVQALQCSFQSGELTDKEVDDEIKKTMQIIQHMSCTIDDFRNFFQQEKNKYAFSVAKAVEQVIELVDAALKCNFIEVELLLDENMTVFGYKNEYNQALLNIIINAKDVLLERKIEEPLITIRAFREHDLAVVTVHDNGGGIDDSILHKIFDPYFTTKGPNKGTGVGLYMSKVIIDKNMGGRLTVANVRGGAEFRIELPAD